MLTTNELKKYLRKDLNGEKNRISKFGIRRIRAF